MTKPAKDAPPVSGWRENLLRRKWLVGGATVAALVVLFLVARPFFTNSAAQNARPPGRIIPVEIATAEREAAPVRLDALGTVTPVASVAVKPRLESVIIGVHFEDGASVKAGELLFTLDSRQIEAQIEQAKAVLSRDRAQLEAADRDVRRYTDLVGKGATTVVNLDNAKTAVEGARAAIQADTAALENLQVQLSYTKITAPITGRISAASVKIGNFVRPSDAAPLASINQMAPVYVSFALPQRNLPDVRKALAAETAMVDALVPGETRRASGQVAMIENAVDQTTGMVTIRATMANQDELLWPGTLVTTRLTLRSEEAVTVPSTAVQVSQTGNFVFVVKDEKAHVQPVTVERVIDAKTVISAGLNGGETVVTDGQLLLSEGTRVRRASQPTS